jgi:glyoxylase-like metal-dependent hydrolase (beta-lactamase superfamily II)
MTSIAPGVQRLGSPLVNFYAVEQDGRYTLVDAGLPAFHDQVAAAVGDLSRLDAIVLTHAHGDHVGVAERLRSEANVPVYVHVADEELARTAKNPKREGSLLPHLRRPATWRLFAHLIANGGARPPRIQEVTTFTDGEVLDVPGRPRVIATPGHTLGHVALHFTDHGVLFSGDEIVTRNPLTGRRGPQIMPSAFDVSSAQCLASLDRLEALEAAVVAPGHGEPWTQGPRAAVEQARANGTS